VRPSRPIWVAWALALVGGLAVIVAAIMVLNDPCVEGGPCTSRTVTVATALAVSGTAVAVTGGLAATYLTVRRSEADRN
jgi:hypothetical protein